MAKQAAETDWSAVIGRALCFLCLHEADLKEKTLTEQADFLERFGIPRNEAAILLGSTPASLNVMDSRKRTTGGKSTRKKATARKRTRRAT